MMYPLLLVVLAVGASLHAAQASPMPSREPTEEDCE